MPLPTEPHDPGMHFLTCTAGLIRWWELGIMGHTREQKSYMYWILEYLQMHGYILRDRAKSMHDIHVCFISTLHTYPELIVCDILVFWLSPITGRNGIFYLLYHAGAQNTSDLGVFWIWATHLITWSIIFL